MQVIRPKWHPCAEMDDPANCSGDDGQQCGDHAFQVR